VMGFDGIDVQDNLLVLLQGSTPFVQLSQVFEYNVLQIFHD